MTNNEDQALNNTACGDPISSQVHPESAMPSIRAKDAAAAGEVDDLLEAHAKAVIAAHECGETGGFYVNLRAAEQAIRDAIAAAPAPQAAPVEAHPLDGLHINQGSMDAAADAYFIEWQKSKCRAAYENRYHKVAALCPYDEWEAAWFKAIAAIQAAPAPSREAAPVAGEGLAALDALARQLARIHLSCRSNAPKLDVRDMLTAMRRMDEWKTLQALLAAPTLGSAPQDLLTIGTLAWALIAPNGNIRFWSRNRSTVERMQGHAADATLTPIIGAAHQAQAERVAVPEAATDAVFESISTFLQNNVDDLLADRANSLAAGIVRVIYAAGSCIAAPVAQEGEQMGSAKNPHTPPLAEYWQAGFDGNEIDPTTRGGALAAYEEGIKARAAPSSTEGSAQAAPADVRDAERYRWLRDSGDCGHNLGKPAVFISGHWYWSKEGGLDGAIDAAMSALRTTSTPADEGAAS